MKKKIKRIFHEQSFYPNWLIGIWINPIYIGRKGLLKGFKKFSLSSFVLKR